MLNYLNFENIKLLYRSMLNMKIPTIYCKSMSTRHFVIPTV